MKKLKKLSCGNCYIVLNQFNLYDVTIPKNTLAYYSKEESTWYFCIRFPKSYNGKAENVTLQVVWYDCELRTIGDAILKNCEISVALYTAFLNASKPKTCKIYCEPNYERLMWQPSKKKKQTGGVRLSEKSNETITDSIKYRQRTSYEYYHNLGVETY